MTLLKKYFDATPSDKQASGPIAYLAALDHIATSSPHIVNSIIKELKDQRSHLKLIASENYSSLAVQLSMGNLLTDKYAEGYPNHRFYAGCENVDSVEACAQRLLKVIFGAESAYVQPHSGADANLVAYWAVLVQRIQSKEIERLGKKSLDELSADEYEKIRQLLVNQKVMGMSLNSGGHLTHGYRHNISSKMMQSVSYDVDPSTELLDYSALAEQVKLEKPLILLAGYSAYPRRLNFAKMRQIADSVGATFIVDMAHFAGLVAGKVFQGEFDPVPYAHIVTSTTHKTLRGPRGGFILCTKEYEEIINRGCPLVLGGPLPHVMASKAIAFQEANSLVFRQYAQRIVRNAQVLAEHFQQNGIRVTTGGTENHLMILDLTNFAITGRQAETALLAAGITLNRNAIPYDKNGPWYTTGIRLGTPALTTLGMGVEEMKQIADIIIEVLKNTKSGVSPKDGLPSKAIGVTDPDISQNAKRKVIELLERFPLYPEIVIDDTR